MHQHYTSCEIFLKYPTDEALLSGLLAGQDMMTTAVQKL